MVNKKFIIPLIVIVLIVTIGLVQVNIINTKALSPVGNTEDNYALVSEEFGEDFTEFIKDDAEVKIYTGEGEDDACIRIKEKEIRLKKENPFIKVFITGGIKIKETFSGLKGKVDNKVKDINKNNEEEKINRELDKTVDDFIKDREENKNGIEEQESEETNWEDNLETPKEEETVDENNSTASDEENIGNDEDSIDEDSNSSLEDESMNEEN